MHGAGGGLGAPQLDAVAGSGVGEAGVEVGEAGGVCEAEAALGRNVLTLAELRDAVMAPKVCFAAGVVPCVA